MNNDPGTSMDRAVKHMARSSYWAITEVSSGPTAKAFRELARELEKTGETIVCQNRWAHRVSWKCVFSSL